MHTYVCIYHIYFEILDGNDIMVYLVPSTPLFRQWIVWFYFRLCSIDFISNMWGIHKIYAHIFLFLSKYNVVWCWKWMKSVYKCFNNNNNNTKFKEFHPRWKEILIELKLNYKNGICVETVGAHNITIIILSIIINILSFELFLRV